MQTINVNVNSSYTVTVGKGAKNCLCETVKGMNGIKKILVVTDENVGKLYGEQTVKALEDTDARAALFILPAGESAKSEEALLSLLREMTSRHFTRTDLLIALGGGTVSDVTGLAAALYMRGTRYLSIPTTLLAMADAAVGGKCAIDFAGVKNVVGTFYQPSSVLIDPDYLSTLPDNIRNDGMAEIIKYTMIDRDFANLYLQNPDMETLLTEAVRLKASVIEKDEKDTGLRKILNFGHTFGHAIEAASLYSLSHGSCVSVGMCIITAAAIKRGYCKPPVLEALKASLSACSLPTGFEGDIKTLIPYILHDKKTAGDLLSLIVPVDVGCVEILDVPTEEIADWLSDGAL